MKKREGDFLQITLHPLIIDLETSKQQFSISICLIRKFIYRFLNKYAVIPK